MNDPVYEDDMNYRPAPPRSDLGIPPSMAIEHLKYYGENESFRNEGDKVVGDVPGKQKLRFFALQNKNVVNANFTDKEIEQSKLRGLRIKMFARMFTPEIDLTAEELMEQDQIELDYRNRLTQGREGFGTRQRTTMTNINLQGYMDPNQNPQQQRINSPRWI